MGLRVIWTSRKWTRESVAADQDRYYIFGDNLWRRGNAGQACIRDLPNAFGVPTKKSPDMWDDSFFCDQEYSLNKEVIDQAIAKIPADKPIVVHRQIGKGLAQLHTRAPRTYAYLIQALRVLNDSKTETSGAP